MIRRYGVLDADGVKVNTITADEALIATDWYPGYGAYLIDEGAVEPDPPPVVPPSKPDTWSNVIPALPAPMQNGDRFDPKTGRVTKAEIVVDEAAVADIKAP